MIRITGGAWRGRQLHTPKGDSVRPTTAFVRESLFSILGPRLPYARVLDLFAGSGIVGFEALSRGARFVQAIEKSTPHARLLEKNRQTLPLSPEQYTLVQQDVFRWLTQLPPGLEPFDIIYCDPPYALTGLDRVIQGVMSNHLLSEQGLIIVESARKAPLPEADLARHIETRTYGTSALHFFTHPAPPA